MLVPLYQTNPSGLASISACVDDRVIRSRSFKHFEVLLERAVPYDQLTGQYLTFDKSMGLCTGRDGEKKL